MQHFGDITKINGADVPIVDVICGGSPCQDLSVAGKRAGLDGERSGLFMDQIRIVKEMRKNGRSNDDMGFPRPRFMVWENVYGAFSSNKGEDFRVVLEEICKVADPDAVVPRLEGGQKWRACGVIMGDGYSVAWRGHDAQYWGVPQRRKRICVLADFNGHSAPRLLFETELRRKTDEDERNETLGNLGENAECEIQTFGEGLPGNTESSRTEREEITRNSEKCIGDTSYTLKVRGGCRV